MPALHVCTLPSRSFVLSCLVVSPAAVRESDAERDASAASSAGDDDGTVIGLSFALGLTLVIIGALAVWKIRVRNNSRRLMDDMEDDMGGF